MPSLDHIVTQVRAFALRLQITGQLRGAQVSPGPVKIDQESDLSEIERRVLAAVRFALLPGGAPC